MTPPLWLIKAAPYIGAVLLVGGAVWYIDHRGYQRAEAEAQARETARKLEQLELMSDIAELLKQTESNMQGFVIDSDNRIVAVLDNIDHTQKTIVQPTLVREIQSEPRLSDPAAGITDGMRGAINSARSLSEHSCPPDSNAVTCVTLSPAVPADR